MFITTENFQKCFTLKMNLKFLYLQPILGLQSALVRLHVARQRTKDKKQIDTFSQFNHIL